MSDSRTQYRASVESQTSDTLILSNTLPLLSGVFCYVVFYLRSVMDLISQINGHNYLSCNMRFPTMWYVQPAKAQTSLRIHTV